MTRCRAVSVLVFSILLVAAGCTSINHREYAPFVRELDGVSQLEISTYPADYPNRLSDKNDTFESYESADDIYFQINIRDKSRSIGRNEHVQSINIHSFSYRIGNEPPTLLLSDYDYNFWMQDNPRYEERDLPPIPFVPGGKVSISISFTLNGERYSFEGDMPASEHSRTVPTAIVNQGV
ncbi:MAG: hypothetical protein QNJ19_11440 [Woeseiaceae bacterium]|nr:hypothetical protein [Woeseiaceae bacterium]